MTLAGCYLLFIFVIDSVKWIWPHIQTAC